VNTPKTKTAATNRSSFVNLPRGFAAVNASADGSFLRIDAASVSAGTTAPLQIAGLRRWMALARLDPYWMRPHFGNAESEIPRETQYLLWEREDGSYGILSADYRR
jgi:hypothetical protein